MKKWIFCIGLCYLAHVCYGQGWNAYKTLRLQKVEVADSLLVQSISVMIQEFDVPRNDDRMVQIFWDTFELKEYYAIFRPGHITEKISYYAEIEGVTFYFERNVPPSFFHLLPTWQRIRIENYQTTSDVVITECDDREQFLLHKIDGRFYLYDLGMF